MLSYFPNMLRLSSPALPIGSYSYSDGLEWAVEIGCVNSEESLKNWINEILRNNYKNFELPFLRYIYAHFISNDSNNIIFLNNRYIASRDTLELRNETKQLGKALYEVFISTDEISNKVINGLYQNNNLAFPTIFSYVSIKWNIPLDSTLLSYVWTWIENQIVSGMKIIPIGQKSGQKILSFFSKEIIPVLLESKKISKSFVSNFSPKFSIYCSKHERQYSRIFRS